MEREDILLAIPIKNPKVAWEENKAGRVRLKLERKDLLYSIMKVLTGKARIDKVPLDKYGSFIWRNIDGKHNVSEIQELLREEYQEEIENLEERVFQYFKVLKGHQFIVY